MSIQESEQSNSLRAIAAAKINLHLEVLGLRKDGFHELAMLMQSIDLFDEIDFTKTNNSKITLTSDDQTLSTGDDNLILRAAKLMSGLSEDKQLGAQIHLKKNLPCFCSKNNQIVILSLLLLCYLYQNQIEFYLFYPLDEIY